MTTGWAHQPPRRPVLQPAISVPSVPEAISRAENPLTAVLVPHTQRADGGSKLAPVDDSAPTLLYQLLVVNLGLAKRIDRHLRQI